jgi:osmotically-inducible protein OsmY
MEDVCDRLTVDDRLDASGIEVNVENNEVVLTGTVTSKDAKRRAEDLAESIPGVRNVENRIRVVAPEVGHTETTNTIIRNAGNMRDRS